MAPLVSVIIVNYNGKRFLEDCLGSLFKNAGCEVEAILVDNASNDGSADYAQKNFPQARVVRSKKNLGFTAGSNLGAKGAKGRYILLLNNDTKLLTSITPAVNEFEKDAKLGALGCRLWFADKSFQASTGFEHTWLRIILTWTGLYRITSSTLFKEVDEDPSGYAQKRDVDWATGAFLMTPKKVWDELGGLDERYFMYVEDGDFCKRARMAGYRVLYSPEVEIIHYRGGGAAWGGEKALLNQMDSYSVYTRKFHGSAAVVILRAALGSLMSLRALAYFTLSLFGKPGMKEKKRAFFRAALRLFNVA